MRLSTIIILSLFSVSISAQSNWTAIMSQGTLAQSYDSRYSLMDVEKFIKEKAVKSQVISELEYAAGKWYMVASQMEGPVKISWKWDETFPSTWVSGEWKEGKDITKVAWGDNSWVVIMTDKSNYTLQKWAIRKSWADLEKWISDTWRENTSYSISELVYANGEWLGVMSVLKNYEPQSYKVSKEFPNKWIQDKYNEKFNISVVENDGLNWYVVMNKKNAQLSEIILNPQESFPEEKIKEQWDNKRRISGLIYTGKTPEFDAAVFFDAMDFGKYNELKKGGDEKLAAKNYSGAIKDYEEALKVKAGDYEILNNLAWAKYNAGYCYSALADADKSISQKSTPYNQHTKGAILKCQGKCSEALPYFNEAIRLYRAEYGKLTNFSYYLDRAEAKKCMKNYAGALDDIDLALAIEPSNIMLISKQKELNSLLKSK